MGSTQGSLAEAISPEVSNGFRRSPEAKVTPALFVIGKNKTEPEVFGEDSQLYKTDLPVRMGGIVVACEGEISNIEEVAFSAGVQMPETSLELLGNMLIDSVEADGDFEQAFKGLLSELKGEFAILAAHKWNIYAGRDTHGEGPTLYTAKEDSPVKAASCDQADVIGAGVRETLELPPNTVLKMGAWAYNLYSLGPVSAAIQQ